MHEKGPNFCESGRQDPLVSLHWTYSLEGYLKKKVYFEPIWDLEHQKRVIKRHIDELKEHQELLKGVMYEITTRVNRWIEVMVTLSTDDEVNRHFHKSWALFHALVVTRLFKQSTFCKSNIRAPETCFQRGRKLRKFFSNFLNFHPFLISKHALEIWSNGTNVAFYRI